ncbi:MAG: hypothetical protein GF317_24500 [Candidatus Lokiarchaeota archaeon]|nr:hypothetical protein [Candidatus Lokiarchaeota archaeon]MBD3202535.1 hypothetical protein [Candidatus Lokiarchaeota archaeon]
MLIMLYQSPDILRTLADIVGALLGFLAPIVTPIGEFMVLWINYVLLIFPDDNLIIYYIIGGSLVVISVIVNVKWPGDKPPKSKAKIQGESFPTSGVETEDTILEDYEEEEYKEPKIGDIDDDADFDFDEDLEEDN